jgi:hypothetical protein
VRADAVQTGSRDGPIYIDGLRAAEEMARIGHLEDSREVYARLVEASSDSDKRDIKVFELRSGVVSKDDVRSEAESAFDLARAGDQPFRVAAGATLGAILYDLADAHDEAREALGLALQELLRLQPESDRKSVLLEIARLSKHLDRHQIERLTEVASTVADQQGSIDSGDATLEAVSPSLVRQKSLHAARRMAERIVSPGRLLHAYATLIDEHLIKAKPDYAKTAIPDRKLPATIVMNTALPP